MKQEGTRTDVTPKSVGIHILKWWHTLAEPEAAKRQKRDSKRDTAWKRGIIKNPHLSGILGEIAFGDFIGQPTDFSWGYDKGWDFDVEGLLVDVKTTGMDVPAIRSRVMPYQKCDAYVWVWMNKKRDYCKLMGWNTLAEFKATCENVTLRRIENVQPCKESMRDMKDLKSRPGANLLRYPGGKTRCWSYLEELLPPPGMFCPKYYVEPFVGGGGMLFRAIRRGIARNIIINDLDRSLMALYWVVQRKPDELIRLVKGFIPTVEKWEQCKKDDGRRDIDDAQTALNKLVLNYCSHAGFGYMAGGPQGGKEQDSDYLIGCRWKPYRITKTIQWLHDKLKSAEIFCQDFQDVEIPDNSLVFIDPPYHDKGNSLYRHGMSQADHERLASYLREKPFDWLVTYDDCPQIRALYKDCSIIEFDNTSGNNHVASSREIAIRQMVLRTCQGGRHGNRRRGTANQPGVG